MPRWRTMIEPAVDDGAVEDLDTEPLGVGVAPVAGGAATFGLGHLRPPATRRPLPRLFGGVDRGDLDDRVVLAVAVAPAALLFGL